MTVSTRLFSSRTILHLFVMLTGLATLSWEVIWQIRSSLALGVSAWGAALTLAITMGGMSAGSLFVSHLIKDKTLAHPVRLYGVLEIVIGLSGFSLAAAFKVIGDIDSWVYAAAPAYAALFHLLSIVALLGIPAMCMGATLPVFGLVARQFRTSIAVLYSLNTLGAAAGVLIAAFILIPQFGMTRTGWIISTLNIIIGISAWRLIADKNPPQERHKEETSTRPKLAPAAEQMVVFITGFATFALEIAWFRALTAAFQSTTDAFAIMLSCVLVSLGVAAGLVPTLRKKTSLGTLISAAGVLILLITPIIERFGLINFSNPSPFFLIVDWFIMTLYVIGAPVLLLGVAFPWILDEQTSAHRWGRLYALNTFATIIGALGAAWILLPAIGFARTAWLTGALVIVIGIIISPKQRRLIWSTFGLIGLLTAVAFESGIGRTHISGDYPGKIIEFFEGPEANVAAVEYDAGGRALVIDGFVAASQRGGFNGKFGDGYMAWMGHLPMLLHPDPKNALVICFGTGQTANAVRRENPKSLDIVDINPRVFKLAHNFTANENVLEDKRVNHIVMDGRAYMRRTQKTYDIITLEPMPPNFAGVNALYSREFYALAKKRLGDNGVIAQWLPFHLVAPHYSASITKTFQDVFPNSILWVEPQSGTGILLGTKDEKSTLGKDWPGFKRTDIKRSLPREQAIQAIVLNQNRMRRYSEDGKIVSDDNQLLAYGKSVILSHTSFEAWRETNHDILRQVIKDVE